MRSKRDGTTESRRRAVIHLEQQGKEKQCYHIIVSIPYIQGGKVTQTRPGFLGMKEPVSLSRDNLSMKAFYIEITNQHTAR